MRTVLHVADVTFEPDASLAVAAVNHLDALLRVAECAEAYIEAREAALDAAGHCTCSGASHDTTNAAGCLRAEAEWSRDQELDNLRRALSILTRLEAK